MASPVVINGRTAVYDAVAHFWRWADTAEQVPPGLEAAYFSVRPEVRAANPVVEWEEHADEGLEPEEDGEAAPESGESDNEPEEVQARRGRRAKDA